MKPEDERAEACFRDFLATGRAEPLEELIGLYRRPLARFIDHHIHDPIEAEALCLDAFTELALRGDRFLSQSSLKTYLFAIGRHLALKRRRKLRREVLVDPKEFVWTEYAPEAHVERLELERELSLAMGRLRPEYAEVLLLRYFEGMEDGEIQSVLGLKNRQLQNRLYRAKLELREQLRESGFEYP